jgi:hypothetical protein
MPFFPQHYGLYFNEQHLENARNQHKNEPMSWAWAWLMADSEAVLRQRPTPTHTDKKATTPVTKALLTPMGQAMQSAYRYRLLGDNASGIMTAQFLRDGNGFEDNVGLWEAIQALMAVAQCFEMVRDHPELRSFGNQWLGAFHQRVDVLVNAPSTHTHERAWQNSLHVVAGMVLESQRHFELGVGAIQQMVNSIHPEGYIKAIVDSSNPADQEGSFWRMLTTVSALTLGAETATLGGENLWSYENRGVGISTAVTYMVYYYFYPDKWKWATGISTDMTRQLFIEHGAFIEIAAHRATLRGVDILLDDQRPLFSPLNGGLTTLTHSPKPTPEKKKRGWLW